MADGRQTSPQPLKGPATHSQVALTVLAKGERLKADRSSPRILGDTAYRE